MRKRGEKKGGQKITVENFFIEISLGKENKQEYNKENNRCYKENNKIEK